MNFFNPHDLLVSDSVTLYFGGAFGGGTSGLLLTFEMCKIQSCKCFTSLDDQKAVAIIKDALLFVFSVKNIKHGLAVDQHRINLPHTGSVQCSRERA